MTSVRAASCFLRVCHGTSFLASRTLRNCSPRCLFATSSRPHRRALPSLFLISPSVSTSTPVWVCRRRDLHSTIAQQFLSSSSLLAAENEEAKRTEDEARKAERARIDEEEGIKKLQKNTRRGIIFVCVFGAAAIVGGIIFYGAPSLDENGAEVKDEFSHHDWTVSRYISRAWFKANFLYRSIREPSRDKLLPEPLVPPYQPPYTVVIEMNNVLVCPEWTYNTGWRFKKRPAVDYFLEHIGYPAFEVVIFTSENGFTATPIIDNLDPKQDRIMYRLFRDATLYTNGHHIKDLSKLNRDLSKVILIDWDPQSFKLQPENALRVAKWTGADDDTYLADLAALLLTIRKSGVADVRPVLEYYNNFANPLEAFRENQRLLIQEEERKRAGEPTGGKPLTKSWSGRLFGYRRHST